MRGGGRGEASERQARRADIVHPDERTGIRGAGYRWIQDHERVRKGARRKARGGESPARERRAVDHRSTGWVEDGRAEKSARRHRGRRDDER